MPSSCVNPADGGGWLWKAPVPGDHRVANTVLSCYLAEGKELADVLDPDQEGTLRPEVFQDPRFFFVPLLHGEQRPGVAGSYAVSGFRGAFLTTETVDAEDSTVSPAACTGTSCNGIRFGTGPDSGKVVELTAFVFPVSALPTEIVQPGNGSTYVAGTKDLVLVE